MGSDGIVIFFLQEPLTPMVRGSFNHWFQWFSMVMDHRSNDAMVSMYRSPLRHSVVKIDARISLSCFSDLSKLLSAFIKVVYVFLTKLSKLVEASALNQKWLMSHTQCLGSVVPLAMFSFGEGCQNTSSI